MCLKLFLSCSLFLFIFLLCFTRLSCRGQVCLPYFVFTTFSGVSAQIPEDVVGLKIYSWKYNSSNPLYPFPYSWKYPGHLAIQIAYNKRVETLSLGTNLTNLFKAMTLSKPIYYDDDVLDYDCVVTSISKLLNYSAGVATIREIKESIDAKRSHYSFIDTDPSTALLNCVTATLQVLQAVGLPVTFELDNPWVIFHDIVRRFQFNSLSCKFEFEPEFEDISLIPPDQHRRNQQKKLIQSMPNSLVYGAIGLMICLIVGPMLFFGWLVIFLLRQIVFLLRQIVFLLRQRAGQVGGGQVGQVGQVGGHGQGGETRPHRRRRKRGGRR